MVASQHHSASNRIRAGPDPVSLLCLFWAANRLAHSFVHTSTVDQSWADDESFIAPAVLLVPAVVADTDVTFSTPPGGVLRRTFGACKVLVLILFCLRDIFRRSEC